MFENFRNDYVQNVLPALFENASLSSVNSVGWTKSGDSSFSLELPNKTLLEIAPRYQALESETYVHFTNLKALFSIINEGSLRLYNLNNSNDPKEFEHNLNNIEDLSDFNFSKYKSKVHLLSLCNSNILNSKNILNMWRLYGDGGYGVAIKFKISRVNYHYTNCLLAKVNYDILELGPFIKAHNDFKHRNKLIESDIIDIIKIPALLHKSYLYSIEEEIRMVIIEGGSFYIKSLNNPKLFCNDINNRNETISYLNIPLFSNDDNYPRLEIKEVQIGFRYSDSQFGEIDSVFQDSCRNYNASVKGNFYIKCSQSDLKNSFR